MVVREEYIDLRKYDLELVGGVAEEILARARVAVVSRDVGGLLGRKVAFSTFSGEIAVYKIERIRETDWYGR